MKEFICKKDFYIEDSKFCSVGEHVVLLPDNNTVVNNNGKQKVTNMPEIINDREFFAPTFEIATTKTNETEKDMVNHPSHYTWLKELCGIEVIDITRHMDFNLGNAVKYILRAGHKKELGLTEREKTVQDLQKAIFYIEDRIKMLNNGN